MKDMKITLLPGCFYLLLLAGTSFAQIHDVLVYGGTVSGIADALSQPRNSLRVSCVLISLPPDSL
ncbi:MAG: hypothetical protein ACKV2V_11220 [Blastocatellia bacterium]